MSLPRIILQFDIIISIAISELHVLSD